jgi:transcriptional regulator with XRE-family HTH domain
LTRKLVVVIVAGMDASDTLSLRVAEEIRAMLGRKRVTGRELARRLGVSQPWVSQRLTGHMDISLNDLQRIADALGLDFAELLPARSHNKTYGTPPVRPTGPRSQRALLAPGHAPERHPTSRPAAEPSGTSRTELRRPAITRHTRSGSST